MWFLFLALLLQQDGREPASIDGFVYGGSGEPLKRAQVSLIQANAGNPARNATTDAGGHYSFADLEPGAYHLWAEKDGFLRQDYGQKRPGRAPRILNVTKGLQLQDISFKLLPTGVIAGRVVNEDGEKLPNAVVTALQSKRFAGQRRLVAMAEATTNDLGDYRLFGLAPGRYYVTARSNTNRPGFVHVPIAYPNALNIAQASPIDVAPGGEAPGVDLQLTTARTATVRGRAAVKSGSGALQGGSAILTPQNAPHAGGGYAVIINADGTFQHGNLPPGRYDLTGTATLEGRPLYARMEIDVSDRVAEPIILAFQPSATLSGRVRFEDESGSVPIGLRVLAGSAQPGAGNTAAIDEKHAFVIERLAPAEYWLDVQGLPRGYYVKSVSAGREELLDRGINVLADTPGQLEIVVSGKGAQVDGTVLHDGNPFSNATVVLVPEGIRRTRSKFFKFATSDAKGHFSLHGITPGDYKLFAWEYVPDQDFQDPGFLARHDTAGKKLSLGEQARESLSVSLIPDNEPF